MNKHWLLGLALLCLPLTAAHAASKPNSEKIAAEFAATVKGVTPAHANTNRAGDNPNLELWHNGTEDVLTYENWGTNSYTRNATNVLQAAGVNLSGISVPSWIPALNQQQLYATAITPQHIISSAHWHPTVGQALFFVDTANHAVSRKIVSDKQIIDRNGGLTDLWIGRLETALPASIKPFKVLPDNYQSLLGDIKAGIPAWVCQGGNTTTANLWTATGEDDAAGNPPNPSKGFDVRFTQLSGEFAAWNTVTHGGSGSPLYITVDKQPVLISILHYMNAAIMLGGPSVADLATEINAALAELDGNNKGYRLTAVKLK